MNLRSSHPLAKKAVNAVKPFIPPPYKPVSKIHQDRKFTLGLLVMSMRFLFQTYRDELAGTTTLIDDEKKFVDKLAKLFGQDIYDLYRNVERAPNINVDREMKKFYESIDFCQEVFETAMMLSEKTGGISGIDDTRKILKAIRENGVRWEEDKTESAV